MRSVIPRALRSWMESTLPPFGLNPSKPCSFSSKRRTALRRAQGERRGWVDWRWWASCVSLHRGAVKGHSMIELLAMVAASYLTPSQAIAQADALDGKRVRIGGFVDLGTNSRCLWDSVSEYRTRGTRWDHVITLSEGASIWKRRDHLNHRFVVVEGTLKRHINEPDVVDLWQCNDVGIEQDSITTGKR